LVVSTLGIEILWMCIEEALDENADATYRGVMQWDCMLRSVTMPIKNFFLSSSLTSARSSLYLRPAYMTGTSLNCNPQNPCPLSGMTLNCTSLVSDPTPGIVLNCNLGHLGHPGHLGHLGNIGDLDNLGHPGHLGHLGHFGHLGHLGHLSNIGDLDTLDPYSHDPAPTDSLPGAFITEMDPTDPGPSEGCYADDSLDPLHARTLETTNTSHTPSGEYHTRQTDTLDGHGPISGILIDALDGHSSFSEIEPQDRTLHK
jgi:hypothetical protein